MKVLCRGGVAFGCADAFSKKGFRESRQYRLSRLPDGGHRGRVCPHTRIQNRFPLFKRFLRNPALQSLAKNSSVTLSAAAQPVLPKARFEIRRPANALKCDIAVADVSGQPKNLFQSAKEPFRFPPARTGRR